MNDQIIIERIKNGEINCFSLLVSKYQNVVFSIALKILKNREDAEEMSQEIFIKAYTSLSSFKNKSKFSTWLFSIAYNTCISKVKKKNKFYSDIVVDNLNIEDEGDNFSDEQIKNLENALNLLEEEDYTLVILFYYEDQSIEDISKIININKNNVKVKLHRVRKRLKFLMNSI